MANTKSQEVRSCHHGWGVTSPCSRMTPEPGTQSRTPTCRSWVRSWQRHLQSLRQRWAKVCQENAGNFHMGQGSFTACPYSVRFISVRKCTKAAPLELLHHSPTAPVATLWRAQSSSRRVTRVLQQVPSPITYSCERLSWL